MDEAAAWAADGAPHGAVVTAEAQRAGRGRHGRAWTGEPGESLLCTIVLRPTLPPSRLGLVPLAAGLAIADAARAFGVEAALKWPNDVRVDARKLAGVLADASWHRQRPLILLGIGMNVGQARFPEHLADTAVSLRQVTGRSVETFAVLEAVLSHLEAALDMAASTPSRMVASVEKRLEGLGERIDVRDPVTGRVSVSGHVLGLATDGALRLATDAGERHVHAGEVTLATP